MPRSKVSRGRGRGGGGGGEGYGSRSMETLFVPFAGTIEQNTSSLQYEALNTQRHHSAWSNDQRLRHAKVNFVSAGKSEPSALPESEAALAEMSLHDNYEEAVIQNPSLEQRDMSPEIRDAALEDQVITSTAFFIDTHGTQSITTNIPLPEIRYSSSIPSDSSEEVIVFAGRDKAGRGISRTPGQGHPGDKYHSQIRVIDDKIQEQKSLLATISREDVTQFRKGQEEADEATLIIPSHSRNITTPGHPSGKVNSSHNRGTKLKYKLNAQRPRSVKQNERQALLDDYIANMEADEVDHLKSYNKRDLGGMDSDIWQDTDVSSESLTKIQSDRDGWNRDELCDFDDLSTSDGVVGSAQAILSKRERKSGLQYLVVWDGQNVDEARWVPGSNLTDLSSMKLIEEFEAAEKLVAIALDDDSTTDSDSDGDGDDDMSLDEDGDNNYHELELKQRRFDRLTDEDIARLLSKQEELGMGSAELLLFRDQGDDQYGNGNMGFRTTTKQTRSGKKGLRAAKRSRREFPAASALADAYDGFDVMDFERPSLKKKAKGRKGKPQFDLSDSELEASMRTAWDNDRMKKREKKENREALRTLGLLGKKNSKPDLKAKYKEGMGIKAVKDEIREFLKGDSTTLALPPMDKTDRKVVHEIANAFNLKSKSAGSGNKRFPILHRTLRTITYNERVFDAVESKLSRRFLPRSDVKGKFSSAKPKGSSRGGFSSAAVSYRDGDIVGGSAPELSMENKGRAMLEKMGWSTGTALGALNNKGILQPVSHVVKTTKAGLG